MVFVGVENAPVVPSPSPDDLRDVCGSFNARAATGADNLHPAPHLRQVYDDALRTIAMMMTLAANNGHCTAVCTSIIMVLLATGGWRPIGLLWLTNHTGFQEALGKWCESGTGEEPDRQVQVKRGRTSARYPVCGCIRTWTVPHDGCVTDDVVMDDVRGGGLDPERMQQARQEEVK